MWDKQSICASLLNFLRERTSAVSEYEIIRHLTEAGCFSGLPSESANLQLFQKHFITRHCLYYLQQELTGDWILQIDALSIQLAKHETSASARSRSVALDARLRDYYLDLENLAKADERSVAALLESFWSRFSSQDKYSDAFSVLELDETANWSDIQLAYRRKVHRAHPDMGGTKEEFGVIQQAYAVLKKRFHKK